MILDTSAIVAVFLKEPGYQDILEALTRGEPLCVGAPTLAETGIVLSGRYGPVALAWVGRFVQEFEVTVVPFGPEHWSDAVSAYARFGKGRHPAGLNFGDCLTYAVAHLTGQPLLCVGADFPQTDLEICGG